MGGGHDSSVRDKALKFIQNTLEICGMEGKKRENPRECCGDYFLKNDMGLPGGLPPWSPEP
ncbi:MAG TPA: hypothetical protein PLO23_06950, partial [Alphaproteobacteria bacterium]|nr:hypothetical protein [Alphaproteobacteria bacterium]